MIDASKFNVSLPPCSCPPPLPASRSLPPASKFTMAREARLHEAASRHAASLMQRPAIPDLVRPDLPASTPVSKFSFAQRASVAEPPRQDDALFGHWPPFNAVPAGGRPQGEVTPIGKVSAKEVEEAIAIGNPVFARYFDRHPACREDFCAKFAKELEKYADKPGVAALFFQPEVYPPACQIPHAFNAGIERRNGKLTFDWAHQECTPDPDNKGELQGRYYGTIDTSFLFDGTAGPLEKSIMRNGLPRVRMTDAAHVHKIREYIGFLEGVPHRYGHFSSEQDPQSQCFGTANLLIKMMTQGDTVPHGQDIRPFLPAILLEMVREGWLPRTVPDQIMNVSWRDRETRQMQSRHLEQDMPLSDKKRVILALTRLVGVNMEGKPWDVEPMQHAPLSKL
ncbi:hypothetical protein [Noviherbaspirillum galbum]|uniref:Uncharacterized protein n=1 Tax=Noviherbaspirillum galbum TaxID=2709383 RepID=A0A6B3SX29_9BURK|nr:hypothetical protein [Noviherbaspirillum galbum]NEX63012.1 hypothetical protein [Noviherbaspirillum galbum]